MMRQRRRLNRYSMLRCDSIGDNWTAKHHYWKSEAKEDHQMSLRKNLWVYLLPHGKETENITRLLTQATKSDHKLNKMRWTLCSWFLVVVIYITLGVLFHQITSNKFLLRLQMFENILFHFLSAFVPFSVGTPSWVYQLDRMFPTVLHVTSHAKGQT